MTDVQFVDDALLFPDVRRVVSEWSDHRRLAIHQRTGPPVCLDNNYYTTVYI